MLFGSSGIRRSYDDTFPVLGMRVGAAVAHLIGTGNSIALGHDSRKTSPLLYQSLTAGCLANGVNVAHCGLVPTPTVAYAGRKHAASAMITASHNPEPDNGIKLFTPDGASFSHDAQEKIEAFLMHEEKETKRYGSWNEQGTTYMSDAISSHKKAILKNCSDIDGTPLILDCGNGAGCTISPALLSEAGAKLHTINGQTAPLFARPSEPLEVHLPYIPKMIQKIGAKAALIHDGDADRLMAFDDKGRYIPGDQLLLLFARHLGVQKVVTTYDASMVLEEQVDVRRTPVGDAHVSLELKQWGDLGGEPSGAWIFPTLSYCPDGPHAACVLAEIASETLLSEEIDSIPVYPILRESLRIEDHFSIMYALGAENPTDGFRFETEDGWCLIRASGTEAKIRITAEGKNESTAKELLAKGHEYVCAGKEQIKKGKPKNGESKIERGDI
ncbi:MAG: phosphoglucomutase [Methanomicrobiales archaeon]|jgi:phosphoglucosamine mutase|nr:phosphoglucomutase [Methanomicrobiales archaeon]